MKSTRLLIIVIIVGITDYGWYSMLDTYHTQAVTEKTTMARAQEYQKKGLYQLAIQSYQDAIEQGQGNAAYVGYLDSCKAYYAEDPYNAASGLEEAYETMTTAYPLDPSYWEAYIQYYLDNDDLTSAAGVLSKADLRGTSSDTIEQQRKIIKYAVTTVNGERHLEMDLMPSAGYFRVCDDSSYGTCRRDGSTAITVSYDSLSQIGNGGLVLAKRENGEAKIIGPDGITYARYKDLSFENAMGVAQIGDDQFLTAIQKDDDTWEFIDQDGNVLADGLEKAGMFQQGAAVVEKDGKLLLLFTDGTTQDFGYDDVKLQVNGSYLFGNGDFARTFTKKNGKWLICDNSFQPVSDFTCDDIDAYIDSNMPIAYKDGDKWGFVNPDGSICMKPAYEEARSFSNGVAAVKKDGEWGFIDGNGEMVVAPQFAEAGYFTSYGTCVVKETEKDGYGMIQWAVSR